MIKKTKLRISIIGIGRNNLLCNAVIEGDVEWEPMNLSDIGKDFELRDVHEIQIADHIGNLHTIGGYMPGKILIHK